eukprot:scaffold279_cov246-Chaetoceros_neogracile.AAC.15
MGSDVASASASASVSVSASASVSVSASASASACTAEATGGVLVDSCVHADSKRSLEIVAKHIMKARSKDVVMQPRQGDVHACDNDAFSRFLVVLFLVSRSPLLPSFLRYRTSSCRLCLLLALRAACSSFWLVTGHWSHLNEQLVKRTTSLLAAFTKP